MGSLINQNPPQHPSGICGPVPWRRVEQSLKVHYVSSGIAFNRTIATGVFAPPAQLKSTLRHNYCPNISSWTGF